MARISKNIKQFRLAGKLTQDGLAEKINVSRQTVSSWETDRTQPDIDMLETLSEVLGVSIEELIYGKKNKVGLEPEKKPNRKIFIIILSVFGSLFLAAGLVMLFIVFWDKIEMAKNIFALLPLITGFGLSFFALTKKKDSTAWRESTALLWTVGLAVTVALINSLNFIDFGFFPLMFLDAVLILPVVLLTEGIFPFVAYVVGITAAPFGFAFDREKMWISAVCTAVYALLFGAVAVIYKKRKSGDVRDRIRLSVFLLSSGAGVVLSAILLSDCTDPMFFGVLAAVCFLISAVAFADRFPDYPLRKIACGILSVITVAGMFFTNDWVIRLSVSEWVVLSVLIAATAVALVINGKRLVKQPVALVLIGFAAVQTLLIALHIPSDELLSFIIGAFPAMGASVAVIASGVTQARMSTANFGMLEAAAVAVILTVTLDTDFLAKGIIITLAGVVLLGVNALMIKKFKKEGEAQEITEVEKDA